MTKPIAYHGLIKDGPLKGTTLAHPSRRYVPQGETSGAYFYRPPDGPTPGTWLWVLNKDTAK